MASDDKTKPDNVERADEAVKRAEEAASEAEAALKVADDVAEEAHYQAEHTADGTVRQEAAAASKEAEVARAAVARTKEAAEEAKRSAKAAREAEEAGDAERAAEAADAAEQAASDAQAACDEAREHAAAAREHDIAAERASLGAPKREPAEATEGEEEDLERRPALYLAEFESARDVLHAAEKVRDAGFKHWDVHTPFPVHGMDKAMGLGQSHLGWICLIMGLTGAIGGYIMMYWMNGVDYPLIIGGKPPESIPSMIPIIFECTILLTGFGAVFGMLGLNKLPRHHHPVFYSERFERCSDDAFFITIEAADAKFDLEDTKKLLQSLHPTHIELVEEEVP